jgi:hypothetical protein
LLKIDECSFPVTINDVEKPSITCPANYEIAADGANQGAVRDLTPDLANVVANDNCGIQSKTITNPSTLPAQLAVGDNVITVTVTDGNNNDKTCTYNINVLPVGACCGAPNVGCIDGVVLADCPEGGFWAADTTCSEDCGNIYQLLLGGGETFSQLYSHRIMLS